MAKNSSRQYTIRNIPDSLDRVLRQRAKDAGKSFNQIALDALSIGACGSLPALRDLSEIAGSLSSDEADRIEEEVGRQRVIDETLWS